MGEELEGFFLNLLLNKVNAVPILPRKVLRIGTLGETWGNLRPGSVRKNCAAELRLPRGFWGKIAWTPRRYEVYDERTKILRANFGVDFVGFRGWEVIRPIGQPGALF